MYYKRTLKIMRNQVVRVFQEAGQKWAWLMETLPAMVIAQSQRICKVDSSSCNLTNL